MPDLDDDVLREYLAECREHLAGIENDLLAIERGGPDIDEELVNKVFRAAHSIKGGAGFFDLNRIRELAHKIENALDLIRSRQTAPTEGVVNVLLLSFDKLRALIGDVASSNDADVSEFVKMLEAVTVAGLAVADKESIRRRITVSTPARATRLSATAFDFETALKAGRFIYLLEYDLIHHVQRRGQKPMDVVKELMKHGQILDTAFDLDSVGSLEDGPSNALSLDVLYATALGADRIGSVVELPLDRMWRAGGNGECTPMPSADSCEETSGSPVPERRSGVADRRAAEALVEPAGEATVRLGVGLLDVLMNLAGELVLGRNQLNDAITRRDHAMIQAASQRISVITSEVQDAVMRTRMQTIGNLFQKFPRVVREIGRKLGKEVRLVEEGGDVELDKTIIEGLSDPLTHMVRNSIDHGIETAEARAAAGKPAAGTVYLRAWHEAGMVVVEVADDGCGLDTEKIGAAAVKKGLVQAQAVAAMSDPEKLALVFLPGLSTAKTVGDLSGRGVGLDVVKTNLDRLGGSVEIHSQPGAGAAFRIKLPLTLAIIPSLLISAGSERMAIPLGTVQELVRVPQAEMAKRIDLAGSASVLMLREGVLPLVRLDQALSLAPSAEVGAALNIVVLSSGGQRYGLVVDRLHGTVEIVVKPVGRHLRHLREYAGATILGDGCVALILDVAGLAGVAGLTGSETASAAAGPDEPPQEIHQLLVFRNSPAEPCAVPLHAASRVLKIKPEDVEHVGGRRTMQQQGRSLPLVTLADLAKANPTPLDRNSIVVVMETGGREFGLLASLPVDVVEAAVEIDAWTLRQPGVMGSTILRGETTLLLDPAALARSACPSGASEHQERGRLSGARVLIAEDSSFYRELVSKVLESEGAETVVAADGEAAWGVLEQGTEDLSLVVTDVEMPRMDGFALTRRIRSNPRTARLPVVVLTSLDADEDRGRGHAAGATAYCIKLDQDELVTVAAAALAGGASDLHQLARHVRGDAPAVTGALTETGERR